MDGMRWFVTAAAVEDFMQIRGEDIDDGPAFHRAAALLRSLCQQATHKSSYGRDGKQFETWRVKAEINGRMRRLNLAVSLASRAEGVADQLVAVADNDDRRQR